MLLNSTEYVSFRAENVVDPERAARALGVPPFGKVINTLVSIGTMHFTDNLPTEDAGLGGRTVEEVVASSDVVFIESQANYPGRQKEIDQAIRRRSSFMPFSTADGVVALSASTAARQGKPVIICDPVLARTEAGAARQSQAAKRLLATAPDVDHPEYPEESRMDAVNRYATTTSGHLLHRDRVAGTRVAMHATTHIGQNVLVVRGALHSLLTTALTAISQETQYFVDANLSDQPARTVIVAAEAVMTVAERHEVTGPMAACLLREMAPPANPETSWLTATASIHTGSAMFRERVTAVAQH